MKLAPLLSAILTGGLVLGSAFADAKDPPSGPKPPKAPKVSVQIDGIDDLVENHLADALEAIGRDSHIPPHVRAELTKRLERVRKRLKDRAAKGKLSPEDLGALGEEIGREMEGFGKDMEDWGKEFEKQMEGKFGGHDDDAADDDDDDDDDDRDASYFDDDATEDLDDAIRDMGALNLRPQQRDQIKKLRADSDAKVGAARKELDRASRQLERQLQDGSTNEAEIARSIDAVSQQEAAIRKARILAWVNARRVLDEGQRKKVERAAKGKSK